MDSGLKSLFKSRSTTQQSPLNKQDQIHSIDPDYQGVLDSPAAREIFRSLDNAFYIRFSHQPFSLVLSSPDRQAGKTVMSLLLAIGSARQTQPSEREMSSDASEEYTPVSKKPGSRTLLIDCTRSFDSIKALGISPTNGFALSDHEPRHTAEFCLQSTGIPGLDICQVFSPDDDYKTLPIEHLEKLQKVTSEHYQRIFIDSEPACKSRDYLVLASIFNHLLLVTRYKKTRRQQLTAQVASLEAIPCELIGSIINKRQFVLPRWLYGGA
ncbi:hypothetical protein [Endozoicomonas arenosclerae]|uniref:hypothetical protein n=1 Tax=Endozoicomonas arenosclerae TaxID=1633495 RepID=UPI00078030A4|nr:hypothetical protein [Endozoicomonas arenosclerae]